MILELLGPCYAVRFTMLQIEFTPEAVENLQSLRKHDQQQIIGYKQGSKLFTHGEEYEL